MSELVYRIDGADRLSAVSANWEAMAAEGGATRLAGDAVLGRSLWDFIRDATLRDIYARLFGAVRSTGRPLSFEYRCDTPVARRLMVMTLTPIDSADIEIGNRPLWAELRPALHSENVFRGAATVRCCSLCNHFQVGPAWVDVTDAVGAGMLASGDRPIRVAFAVCGACRSRIETMLWRLEKG